ncbi:MAG TPA: hypothetical protein VJA94_00815 [Candidatus Angelobacter sp.]
MKTLSLSLIACSSLIAVLGLFAQKNADSTDWAEQAISTDSSVAQKAQEHLRAAGPQGLQLLERSFAREISAHRKGAVSDARWGRIATALDRVGGQYDNYASGLYWYTDLEKAQAAARASGKPILSLRLLGHLDEDLSCANSRFFRTTLYPSKDINALLKDRFILHWESVRPAPKVTIDFGDGRKLVRTITGNSIHYVLDADGNIVDVLPGLYSAAVFAGELRRSADAVEQAKASGSHDYQQHLKSTEARLLQAWASDLQRIQVSLPATFTAETLEQLMDSQKWQQMAQLHFAEGTFDPNVRAVAARKFPDAVKAAPVAASKSEVESPMLRAMRNLRSTVALDTVRDNYMLRSKILDFMTNSFGRNLNLAQLNDWVYASIFLTPGEDPWLGLAPADVFSAIDKNGEGQ